MYADEITESMKKAIDETNRRRTIQIKFNEENGITPKTIVKDLKEPIKIKDLHGMDSYPKKPRRSFEDLHGEDSYPKKPRRSFILH